MKRLLNVNYNETNLNIGLLILRVLIGILMAFYGYQKLTHFNEMADDDFWKNNINFLGLGSNVSVGLTVFAEFFCSLFLLVGLFTRLSLIPLIFCMSYIVAIVDKMQFLNHGEHGYEFSTAFIYLVIYVVLIFTGPGKWSLDNFICNRK